MMKGQKTLVGFVKLVTCGMLCMVSAELLLCMLRGIFPRGQCRKCSAYKLETSPELNVHLRCV